MSRNQTSNIKRQYILAISPGATYSIHRDISPYSISTKGYIPTLGIHLGKRITRSLEIEGFISGGIIFAECGLLWEYQGMDVLEAGIDLYESETSLQDAQLDGKGTGFALKGVAPPTHSRSARCRSFGGFISKACFFASCYRILLKRSLNEKQVTLIVLLLLVLITGFPKEPGNMQLPFPCFIVIKYLVNSIAAYGIGIGKKK